MILSMSFRVKVHVSVGASATELDGGGKTGGWQAWCWVGEGEDPMVRSAGEAKPTKNENLSDRTKTYHLPPGVGDKCKQGNIAMKHRWSDAK